MVNSVILVEARTEDGRIIDPEYRECIAPGKLFYLVFDENYFFDGEYLRSEEDFVARLFSDGKPENNKFVYKAESPYCIPFSSLKKGTKFHLIAAFVKVKS